MIRIVMQLLLNGAVGDKLYSTVYYILTKAIKVVIITVLQFLYP